MRSRAIPGLRCLQSPRHRPYVGCALLVAAGLGVASAWRPYVPAGVGCFTPIVRQRSEHQPAQRSWTISRAEWGQSEIEHLRRENEELKRRLDEKQREESSGILGAFLRGVKNVFESLWKPKPQQEVSAEQMRVPKPNTAELVLERTPHRASSGLGRWGSFFEPMFDFGGGLLTRSLQESKSTVTAVLSQAQESLQKSGRLGQGVVCDEVFSRSYSSTSINGKSHAEVRLKFKARGNSGSGIASCAAAISDGKISLRDLRLDGVRVKMIDGIRQASTDVEVVDVEPLS